MTELIVNIFVYGDGTHVNSIGWRVYKKVGSYEELTNFLQSRVHARPSERATRISGETCSVT